MDFKLLPLEADDLSEFKKDMQEAFQKGAMSEFANINTLILPEKDIDNSLSKEGAKACKAIVSGDMVGGVIVDIVGVTGSILVTSTNSIKTFRKHYSEAFCF